MSFDRSGRVYSVRTSGQLYPPEPAELPRVEAGAGHAPHQALVLRGAPVGLGDGDGQPVWCRRRRPPPPPSRRAPRPRRPGPCGARGCTPAPRTAPPAGSPAPARPPPAPPGGLRRCRSVAAATATTASAAPSRNSGDDLAIAIDQCLSDACICICREMWRVCVAS